MLYRKYRRLSHQTVDRLILARYVPGRSCPPSLVTRQRIDFCPVWTRSEETLPFASGSSCLPRHVVNFRPKEECFYRRRALVGCPFCLILKPLIMMLVLRVYVILLKEGRHGGWDSQTCKISRRKWERRNSVFPIQLTTSRIYQTRKTFFPVHIFHSIFSTDAETIAYTSDVQYLLFEYIDYTMPGENHHS